MLDMDSIPPATATSMWPCVLGFVGVVSQRVQFRTTSSPLYMYMHIHIHPPIYTRTHQHDALRGEHDALHARGADLVDRGGDGAHGEAREDGGLVGS